VKLVVVLFFKQKANKKKSKNETKTNEPFLPFSSSDVSDDESKT
jgi:hypothetical protein